MRVPRCSICCLAVLELDGQFQVLQGYFAPPDAHGDPAIEIAGEVHSKCLVEHVHGPRWSQWLARVYEQIWRFERVGADGDWTVYAGRTDVAALHRSGATAVAPIGCKRVKRKLLEYRLVDEDDHNLHFDDERDAWLEFRDALERDNEVPIQKLLDLFAIADRMLWPDALMGGKYIGRRRIGAGGATVRVTYAQYLPRLAIDTLKRLARA